MTEWLKEYNYIKGYATKYKLRNTLKALALARKYHEGQTRYSGEPYIIHPLMVCKNLILLNVEKALHEWYPDKSMKWARIQCDILYAAALLHDVIEDLDLPNEGQELVKVYFLDQEVLVVDRLLTKLPKKKKRLWSKIYDPEKYFGEIAKDWRASLIKIVDRAHNCSTMQVFKEEKMKEYILETIKYIYTLCVECELRYPEFSNIIAIEKNLIASICESLASILGMQEVITDEKGGYMKTINFIEGATRTDMPNTYKALSIAYMSHFGQKRTSGDPFIIHPLRVCSYLMALEVDDDVTYASALLHEVPQKNGNTIETAEKLFRSLSISEEVINVVRLVADKNKPQDVYYDDIKKNPKALLEKLSNRVHTCTFLAGASPEDMEEYIKENKNFIIPMCQYGMLHYPQYANMIEIMRSHILAISNIVEIVSKQTSNKG